MMIIHRVSGKKTTTFVFLYNCWKYQSTYVKTADNIAEGMFNL